MELNDFSPIKHFSIKKLGNTIIIAGANGSGKTRLKDAIVKDASRSTANGYVNSFHTKGGRGREVLWW